MDRLQNTVRVLSEERTLENSVVPASQQQQQQQQRSDVKIPTDTSFATAINQVPGHVFKRQQGWHTMYGKRQQGWNTMYGKRQQGWNTMHGKRQQGWNTMYGKRQQAGADSDVSGMQHTSDGFDNTTLKKLKRQQHWQTMYGKRNNDDVIRSVLKRQQGWEIAYGKRSDDEADDVTTRQREWNSLFQKHGAGTVVVVTTRPPYEFADERRQRWHSTHGKHRPGSSLNKRQQGWETQYGKRALHSPALAEPFDTKTVDQGNSAVLSTASKESRWSHTLHAPSILSPGAGLSFPQPEDRNRNSRRVKRQQGWHNPYGKRSVGQEPIGGAASDLTSALASTFLDSQKNLPSYLIAALYSDFFVNDDVDLGDDFDEGSNFGENMVLEKRQQGWYTPYGKRSVGV